MNKEKRRPMMKNNDGLLLLILGIICTDYFLEVRSLPKPEVNMVFVGPVFYVFSVLFIVYLLKFFRFEIVTQTIGEKLQLYFKENTRIFIIVIAGLIYAVLFSTIGFFIGTILFMVTAMYLLGVRSKLQLLLIPLCTAIMFWLFFEVLLMLELPVGLFSLSMLF